LGNNLAITDETFENLKMIIALKKLTTFKLEFDDNSLTLSKFKKFIEFLTKI